jgi:hypothetical protein
MCKEVLQESMQTSGEGGMLLRWGEMRASSDLVTGIVAIEYRDRGLFSELSCFKDVVARDGLGGEEWSR